MAEVKDLDILKKKAAKAKVSEAPVSTFMSKNPVSINEGSKISSAIQSLSAHKIGSAPVINGQNKIIGMISEHDLLIQSATRDVDDPIEYIKELIIVTPDTPLKDALVLLYKKKVRRIPVVTNREVVGIVTRMDVLLKLTQKEK